MGSYRARLLSHFLIPNCIFDFVLLKGAVREILSILRLIYEFYKFRICSWFPIVPILPFVSLSGCFSSIYFSMSISRFLPPLLLSEFNMCSFRVMIICVASHAVALFDAVNSVICSGLLFFIRLIPFRYFLIFPLFT